MAGKLEPYRDLLLGEILILRDNLAHAKVSLRELAIQRVTTDIMTQEYTKFSVALLNYDKIKPSKDTSLKGPERWFFEVRRRAEGFINPNFANFQQLLQKEREYQEFAQDTILKLGEPLGDGAGPGKKLLDLGTERVLILGANPAMKQLRTVIAQEFIEWGKTRPNTKEFFELPMEQAFALMMLERHDLKTLIRLVDKLPLDVTIRDIPVESKTMFLAVDLAISLIPVVGTMVAAFEVISGYDLFGNELSDLERGVIGATILLPMVGRLASAEGRALYSEARLVQLYGRDAATWKRAIAVSGLTDAERAALGAVERAEKTLVTETRITGAVAREAATATSTLARGGTAINRQVDQAVVDLLGELQRAHPELRSLDVFALERVMKKTNVNHIKGQLLEELTESKVVPWLQTRDGAFALGLEVPPGAKLEFFPGHSISDPNGGLLTDGMLGYRDGSEVVSVAVFESKSGPPSSLKLTGSKSGRATAADKAELRAAAKDDLAEQRAAAIAAGKRFRKSQKQVEGEIIKSELGGQVRTDIERLTPNVGHRTTPIRIGAEIVEVRFDPRKTKFFGIVPKDVPLGNIERQLIELKLTYELIAVDMKAAELIQAAERIEKVVLGRLAPPTPTPTPTPTPGPTPSPTPEPVK